MRKLLLVPMLWLAFPAGCDRGDEPATVRVREVADATPATGVPEVSFHETGVRPRSLAIGRFNADAHLDVVVANSGDDTVTVLLGDATGQLHPSASFAAGREPSDVDAVDIDRDGDVDLIVANHETPDVTVLLNDGRGNFAQMRGSPFDTGARPHIHGLASVDVDGDGWVDVAAESADSSEVRLLRGGPRGLSAAEGVPVGTMPYFRLGIGQVIGDARPDILVPGHNDKTVRAIESREGKLHAVKLPIRLTAQPWMVVAGDVDGDRRDDVIVVETDAVSVWLARGRGFAPSAGSPFSIPGANEVAVGDLDGDGIADIAVGPWDGDEVSVLIGRAPTLRKVRMCERPIGLAIADLNGDGRGELLATCTTLNTLAVTTVVPR